MLNDLIAALEEIDEIENPEADNEGDAINDPENYDRFNQAQQDLIDRTIEMAKDCLSRPSHTYGYEPDYRAISEINNTGANAVLEQDPEEPNRLIGYIDTPKWRLRISDDY